MIESGARSAKMRTLRLLALAGCAFVGLLGAAPGAEGRMKVGFSDGQFLFARWHPNTGVFPNETAKLMGLTGVRLHRFQFQWQEIEKEPLAPTEEHDWGRFGAMIQRDRANGIKSLLVINSAPRWAYAEDGKWSTKCTLKRCNVPPGPGHFDDFREFIQTALLTFPSVVGIEVWNEPNAPGKWQTSTGPNAKQYTKVLCQAYGAVQQAEPFLDRKVPVLTGSPHNHGTKDRGFVFYKDFLNRVYRLMGDQQGNVNGRCFDAIGLHAYGKKVSIPKGDRLFDTVKSFRKITRQNGDRRRGLWITETGFATPPTRNLSEKQQNRGIRNTLEALENQRNVKAAFMFSLIEGYTAPGYSQVDRPDCRDPEVCPYNVKRAFCKIGRMLSGRNPCGDRDNDGVGNVKEVRFGLDYDDFDFDDDGTKDGPDSQPKNPFVVGKKGAAPNIISPPSPTNGASTTAPVTFEYRSDIDGDPSTEWGQFRCRLTPSGQSPPMFADCDGGSITYSSLTPGGYTFEVRAVDANGTTGLIRSRSFNVAS